MASLSNPKIIQNSKFKIQNYLFESFWRLSIFILPWQTRWFADAELAGQVFEQGRLSFYISWPLLIAVIVLGMFNQKQSLPIICRRSLFWVFVLLGAICIVSIPVDIRTVIQWWLQIFLLCSFFIALFNASIPYKTVAVWLLIALFPHAILAIIQSGMQFVRGSSWLGMSGQSPLDLGVSVVQTDSLRFLRAYGGFPHPNILGGFMALAILIAVWLYQQISSLPKKVMLINGRTECSSALPLRLLRWRELCILSAMPVFTAALFYSFSRSAWLALVAGLLLLQLSSLPRKNPRRGEWLLPALPVLIAFTILAVIHLELTATRLGWNSEPARLERISTQARSSSLRDGLRVFQAFPIFGAGPNSELPALNKINNTNDVVRGTLYAERLIEPPHNVFILMLANFGVVGALIIFGFLLFLLRQVLARWNSGDKKLRNLMLALVGAWFIISLFDHYPWSFWSGQAISFFIFYTVMQYIKVNGAEPHLDN